jgi:hypothetical protein
VKNRAACVCSAHSILCAAYLSASVIYFERFLTLMAALIQGKLEIKNAGVLNRQQQGFDFIYLMIYL